MFYGSMADTGSWVVDMDMSKCFDRLDHEFIHFSTGSKFFDRLLLLGWEIT